MAADQSLANAKTSISIPRERYDQLRSEQNLPLALLAGIGAAFIGAAVWATVTVMTEFQIGYMAIAVGFIVGYAVRLGRGIEKIFGIIGGIFALFGCALGNVFSLIGFISKQHHLSILDTVSRLDLTKIPQLLTANFSVMDLVFYGIAVYEGYRFSFRRLTSADAAL
ncbi:MAG: hypothetical protein QOI34_1444 [Verrucomicrobiota bacterium]